MIIYETDSKKVKKGQIFVAIKGHTVDGHNFIEEAINNGASKIIGEKDLNLTIPYEKVLDSKKYLKEHLFNEYSNQFKNLKIIGITGTNGKTTSCYLIYQMLQKLGKNVSYIGTIGFYHNDEYIALNNTTPDILTLYKLLLHSIDLNVEYIVMEISSHSLYEERIKGLKLDAAAFTNLTSEHLDFHKSMDGYLESKLKILNYLKDNATIMLNDDDKYSSYFKKNKNFQTYGLNGDYKIIKYDIKPNYTNLKFSYNNNFYNVETNLTGVFNIYNFLTALSILNNLNFNINDLIKISKDIYPPKGRCETYTINHSYVVIDYAHTPDAVNKVINAYLELPHNKIITILGCGGDRDKFKRPLMGNIATNNSDYVIFTNDNPRNENEKDIINDIIKDNKNSNYEIIYDRKNAILKGLSLLKENDILLILGKGHENYQLIKGIKYHFDDSQIVKEYINNKK